MIVKVSKELPPKDAAAAVKSDPIAKAKKPMGFAMAKLMGPSRREKTRSDISESRK